MKEEKKKKEKESLMIYTFYIYFPSFWYLKLLKIHKINSKTLYIYKFVLFSLFDSKDLTFPIYNFYLICIQMSISASCFTKYQGTWSEKQAYLLSDGGCFFLRFHIFTF